MILAGSAWAVHRVHLLLLAPWVLVVLGSVAWSRLRGHPGLRPVPRTPAVLLAAAGTVVSAAVHLSVIREHFAESARYGVFFCVLAAVQLLAAAWLAFRPARAVLGAAAAASAGVVLLWLVTRTVGLPFGPEAGEVEQLGAADLIATAAELLTTAAALAALRTGRGWAGTRPAPRTRAGATLEP